MPEEGCGDIQEAHHLRGMAHIRLESPVAAKDALRRCIEINPASRIGMECEEALESL